MAIFMNESFKHDSIFSVFCAVADEGCNTRAEIAASAGLSTPTACKVTEAFLDNGIFVQRMKPNKSVGRHAGRLSLDQSKCLVIIDLSAKAFSFSVFDLSLKCVSFIDNEYIEDFNCSENLCMFLHRVKSYLLNNKSIRYIAIGLIVPGIYDRKNDTISESGSVDFDNIKIREFAKSMAGMAVDMVTDHSSAAVRYCTGICKQDENLLYINTSHGIDARLIINGKAIKKYCSSKPIIFDEQNILIRISTFIRIIMSVVGISKVIIESSELRRPLEASKMLTDLIKKEKFGNQIIPGIEVNRSVEYSTHGAAMILRKCWLERLLK